MNGRFFIAICISSALMVFTNGGLHAQESETLEIIGKSYVIEEWDVINSDILIDGGALSIAGDVNGDIEIKGSSVSITGEVVGNISVDSSSIGISGVVEGDISGVTSGITINEGGFVEGDIETSGTLTVIGEVDGDVKMREGSLILHGEITGDVSLDNAKIIYQGGHYYGDLYTEGTSTIEEGEGMDGLGGGGVSGKESRTEREGVEGKGGEERDEDTEGWTESIWEDTYFEDLADWERWSIISAVSLMVIVLFILVLVWINKFTGSRIDGK